MNAPRIAPQPPEPSGTADDPNDPDLCVCGALIVSELVPTLKEVRDRLVVIESRVGALESRSVTFNAAAFRRTDHSRRSDDHVCVFVDGFDRCSWCGVAR